MDHDRNGLVKQTLRLDADLHDWLTVEAKNALRSLNSEIRQRLRKALSDEQPDVGR